ncbi:MAG: AAA family ATPase, partial [Thermoanaerobaculum sp.]|nr:AAA family ATPase [Thermoanaerobaculum sp.]
MIMRVFVDGYKSLRNVELELQPLTVIVGPNAAGKSNLFDALRLLSRIVTSRSLAEAFGDHRGDPLEAFDYSERGIAGLLEKEEARFTIE